MSHLHLVEKLERCWAQLKGNPRRVHERLARLGSFVGFISEEKAIKRTSLLWERGEDLCRTLNPCRRTAHSWYNLVWYILHVLTSPMVQLTEYRIIIDSVGSHCPPACRLTRPKRNFTPPSSPLSASKTEGSARADV